MSVRSAVVIVEPLKVHARLRALGLEQGVLHGALGAGMAASALCTPHHPPNFGGISLWAEAVRWLRDTLVPHGWIADNTFGFPTIVRGDGGISIAVARGDSNTGKVNATPTTQYPRGTVLTMAVHQNAFLPFPHLPKDYGKPMERTTAQAVTWLLLHSKQGDSLQCELSCPIEINGSGFVEEWSERIILGAIPIDPTRIQLPEDEPVHPTVTVKRRA